jgi:phage virion morphogenesis protein
LNVRIEIKADQVLNGLRSLSRRLDNLQVPMKRAATYMVRETQLNFAKQSTPDGAGWAALAPSTLLHKKSGAILRESGALAASISIVEVSSSRAIVGSSGVDYGIFHQMGTSKMPAREFIGISDRHTSKIKEIFEAYLLASGSSGGSSSGSSNPNRPAQEWPGIGTTKA